MKKGCYRAACALLFLALCLTGCSSDGERVSSAEVKAESGQAASNAAQSKTQGTEKKATGVAVLPETADAGQEYIDETVFIGDSNTVRYMMYADESGKKGYTTLYNDLGVTSMGVGAIPNLRCQEFSGYSQMLTIPEAVAVLQPLRVVACYGTNNLSGSSTDTTFFIAQYKEGLAAVHEAWPYADIIVSSVPPLDELRLNENLTMTQVDAYNEAIEQMCADEGYKYLNTAETLKDADGWAKTDYTLSDGVHLSMKAIDAVFAYLRTHAYITEDSRPKPLDPIPEPKGSPVGLIGEDPIAVREKKAASEAAAKAVTVYFAQSGEGYFEGETTQVVQPGSTCTQVWAHAAQDWTFDHWECSAGGVATPAAEALNYAVAEETPYHEITLTAIYTYVGGGQG